MNRYLEKDGSEPVLGAAYIRYSSLMQSDSFSLDAQLRQIREQAGRDGVTIVQVFSDPAQSAYRKRFRPGINAMREAARRKEFKILYVHKVDRLARRLEWALEIVHELLSLDIDFKAVEQPFDLSKPEGKFFFHMISSLSEFYSDNLSKETNKGKYESSRQGYHNGHVPWGYVSVLKENRHVGVPDPEAAPMVQKVFELYSTGRYSDEQMAEYLNQGGFKTWRGRIFSKDTIRDLIQNPYYLGKVRYKGMSVHRGKASYRRFEGELSPGQHEAIISEELWQKCQKVRQFRTETRKQTQVTRHVYLLNGIVHCSHCGRRLRAHTPNCGGPTGGYYREVSHMNGFTDCPCLRMSVHSYPIDEQIAALVQSLSLPADWEQAVRKMLQEYNDEPDPEVERKEIRELLRRKRTGYEHGLYKEDEHVYWREVESLKERLAQLERPQEKAINRAAEALPNLKESWKKATREEQRELVQLMLLEVGCDLLTRSVAWIKPQPGYEVLFRLLSQLRPEEKGRFVLMEPIGNKGQMRTQGKTFSKSRDNGLTDAKPECTMPSDKGIKSEIAQRSLSDFRRNPFEH